MTVRTVHSCCIVLATDEMARRGKELELSDLSMPIFNNHILKNCDGSLLGLSLARTVGYDYMTFNLSPFKD